MSGDREAVACVNPDVTRPDWCPGAVGKPCEIPLCLLFLEECGDAWEAVPKHNHDPAGIYPNCPGCGTVTSLGGDSDV